jgi:hypothetical protein
MKHFLRAASCLLLAALVVPAFAFDDPKPADAKKADKADPAAKKGDDKKDDAKKDEKGDKADPAKKDDKPDAAKKGDDKKGDKGDPAAKKDDKAAKKPAAKKEHVVNEKTIKAGEIVGRVVSVNGTGKVVRLKVTYEIPKLNEGAYNGLNQARVNLAQAQLKRDFNGMAQAQAEIARNSAQMYKTETKEKEVEITAADDVVVRNQNPPEQYDAKGRPKRLTEKERRELKGPDTKTPGFPAEFTDLRQDQIVQVTLVRNKDTARRAPRKAKDVEAALSPENLPHASRIMILADAPQK